MTVSILAASALPLALQSAIPPVSLQSAIPPVSLQSAIPPVSLQSAIPPVALQGALPARSAPTADAPSAEEAPTKPSTFADLSLEEVTAPRCGVAFAIAQGWQNSGDERGNAVPDLKEAGAREFFLGAMVRLIDRYGLERSDVSALVQSDIARHQANDFADIGPMMPACLVLLETSRPKPQARVQP